MTKFIPYQKLSKKKKRELDLKRRNTWSVSPVTRKPPNPKAYNRKKTRKEDDDEVPFVSFVFKIFTEKCVTDKIQFIAELAPYGRGRFSRRCREGTLHLAVRALCASHGRRSQVIRNEKLLLPRRHSLQCARRFSCIVPVCASKQCARRRSLHCARSRKRTQR